MDRFDKDLVNRIEGLPAECREDLLSFLDPSEGATQTLDGSRADDQDDRSE